MRPYSWIIGGLGSGSDEKEKNYSKELVSKKVMFCNTINKKELSADGTNAVGMIDVDFGTSSGGWYENNKAQVGRFVAKDGDRTANKSVAYVLEKMKNPSEMVLLADSFIVDNNDREAAFWTFNPNGGKSKFNHATGEGTSDARIATVHVGSTTVAYADGRAEALTPGRLGSSTLKLTKYYDDNFAAKDL